MQLSQSQRYCLLPHCLSSPTCALLPRPELERNPSPKRRSCLLEPNLGGPAEACQGCVSRIPQPSGLPDQKESRTHCPAGLKYSSRFHRGTSLPPSLPLPLGSCEAGVEVRTQCQGQRPSLPPSSLLLPQARKQVGDSCSCHPQGSIVYSLLSQSQEWGPLQGTLCS